MRFEKWQGLGNDFILVEDEVDRARARALCDRRFGIGADGVLSVTTGSSGARMVVTNADGSRPEMCGNGLRCVVGWAAARAKTIAGELTVETDAGARPCGFVQLSAGDYRVHAAMGRATVGEPYVFEAGRSWGFVPVDVGNPHAVSFDPHDDADLDVVGPALERHQPGGVNVELCRQAERLEVVVWERGVGRTLACGTGACAVAAAFAAREGAFDRPLEVVLPGGALAITVAADLSLMMEGPARRVFAGEV